MYVVRGEEQRKIVTRHNTGPQAKEGQEESDREAVYHMWEIPKNVKLYSLCNY